jgi:DNA repair exonuclease SbcCD ATPase subunit
LRMSDLTQNHLEVGAKCPVCLEAITQNSINNIESILSGLRSEIEDNEKKIQAIDKSLNQMFEKTKQMKQEFELTKTNFTIEFSEARQKEESEHDEVDNKLSELKQQLLEAINKALKEEIADLEKNAAIMQKDLNIAEADQADMVLKDKQRQDLVNSIAEYKQQINTMALQIDEMKKKTFDDTVLKSLKIQKHQQLEVIQKKQHETKDIRAELVRLEFWKEGFSQRGIPSILIDQAIPSMNKSMKKYLELLSNGRYIVTFDTISSTKSGEYRDKFSVNVLDTKTQVTNKKQLSGGQTRLIDIATILTLRELKAELGGIDFNLFIFDEIFDALDDANIGYVCNILNTLKENKSIFVIAHKHQDELEADRHIQLT